MRTYQGHVDVARFENRGLHDEIPKLAPTDATEYLTMVTRAQSAFFTSFCTAVVYSGMAGAVSLGGPSPSPSPSMEKHDVSVMHPTSGLVRNSKPMTEDRRQKHLVQPAVTGNGSSNLSTVTEPRNEETNPIRISSFCSQVFGQQTLQRLQNTTLLLPHIWKSQVV